MKGSSIFAMPMSLCFLVITTFSVFADQPPYYELSDVITIDCSPSVPLSDWNFPATKGLKLDISTVSREYATDPASPGWSKVAACIFTKPFTFPFSVPEGPKFIRLYFKPLKYAGLNISKALFFISAGQHTLINTTESSNSIYNPQADYVIREFCIRADSQLNVTFTPSRFWCLRFCEKD